MKKEENEVETKNKTETETIEHFLNIFFFLRNNLAKFFKHFSSFFF